MQTILGQFKGQENLKEKKTSFIVDRQGIQNIFCGGYVFTVYSILLLFTESTHLVMAQKILELSTHTCWDALNPLGRVVGNSVKFPKSPATGKKQVSKSAAFCPWLTCFRKNPLNQDLEGRLPILLHSVEQRQIGGEKSPKEFLVPFNKLFTNDIHKALIKNVPGSPLKNAFLP